MPFLQKTRKPKPVVASHTSHEAAEIILKVARRLKNGMDLLSQAEENPAWFWEKVFPHCFRIPGSALNATIDKSQHLHFTINQIPANERAVVMDVIKARIASMTRSIVGTSEPLQLGEPVSQAALEAEVIEQASKPVPAAPEQPPKAGEYNFDDLLQDEESK